MIRIALVGLAFLAMNCKNASRVPPPQEVEVLVANLYGGTGGLSVDKQGNIYSSDFGPILGEMNFKAYSKIFRIAPDGKVSVFADSILGASGSTFDAKGFLYQSNIDGNFISKISPEGIKEAIFSHGLSSPVGVIVDENGEIVVCNCGDNTLSKISSSGEATLFAKSKLFNCPNGITRDENGNYYVSNFYNGAVIKIAVDGLTSELATIPGNNNGHIVYHKGYLFVVARTANQIYKVALDGKIELFAGSGKRGRTNGSRMNSSFNFPNDLDFSPDGKFLYVNEEADTLGDPKILLPTVIRRITII